MGRWLWKSGVGLLVLVFVLALVVLVNTWRLPGLAVVGASPSAAPPAGLDAAAKRLSAAIQIPTVSQDSGHAPETNHFLALHRLLEESFPRVHATLKREIVNGSSLLYTWQGSDPSLAPILLTAHLDVVPVEPGTEGSWTHPPFSGAIADGYVWGRGAQDMKHVVMATLESIERLLADGAQPKRTVLLAFGHDEEIGGQAGAKAIVDLLEQRKTRALFSLDEGLAILDGVIPGATRPIAQIGLSEKGGLSLLLKATAKGGHSSMPPPHTAVGKIGGAVARLELHQMPATLDGPGGKGLLGVAPALPFGLRAALANQWLFGPLLIRQLSESATTNALIRTTTAPTIIQGGVKENVLPSEATAVVNFRLAPGDTLEQVKEHVRSTVADPDVTFTDYRGPGAEATAVADMNGPGYAMIADAIRSVAPDAVVTPGLVVTGTDSKHYARVSDAAYRFTPMRLTPVDIGRIHGTDERIGIVNYGELIAFYVTLVRASAM